MCICTHTHKHTQFFKMPSSQGHYLTLSVAQYPEYRIHLVNRRSSGGALFFLLTTTFRSAHVPYTLPITFLQLLPYFLFYK